MGPLSAVLLAAAVVFAVLAEVMRPWLLPISPAILWPLLLVGLALHGLLASSASLQKSR